MKLSQFSAIIVISIFFHLFHVIMIDAFDLKLSALRAREVENLNDYTVMLAPCVESLII